MLTAQWDLAPNLTSILHRMLILKSCHFFMFILAIRLIYTSRPMFSWRLVLCLSSAIKIPKMFFWKTNVFLKNNIRSVLLQYIWTHLKSGVQGDWKYIPSNIFNVLQEVVSKYGKAQVTECLFFGNIFFAKRAYCFEQGSLFPGLMF